MDHQQYNSLQFGQSDKTIDLDCQKQQKLIVYTIILIFVSVTLFVQYIYSLNRFQPQPYPT